MNHKGLLLTVMTAFTIIGLLGTITLLNDASNQYAVNETTSFLSVAHKYRNIERSLIDFDKIGYNKNVSDSVLGFKYSLFKDLNSINLSQDLPLSETKINDLFDFYNAAKIFVLDTNRKNVYDGLIVDVNVPKNSYWAGSQKNISFLINPFCYSYTSFDSNTMLFAKSTSPKCLTPFSPASIKRIDINLTFNGNDDFNNLLCNSTPCPQDPFNPVSANPYYSIQIIDSNCPKCSLPQKKASAHFNPNIDFNITVSCSGSTCSSSIIKIRNTSLDFNIFHSGGRISVATSLLFNNYLNGFIVDDINLLVKDPTGNYSKKSR